MFMVKIILSLGHISKIKKNTDFRILNPPSELEQIFNNLKNQGIDIYYGEWLVDGLPHGFLINFKKYLDQVDSLKYELWQKFNIDSLRTGQDYNEPIAWSKAVSEFLTELVKDERFQNSIFHFHEWLSGGALILIKRL